MEGQVLRRGSLLAGSRPSPWVCAQPCGGNRRAGARTKNHQLGALGVASGPGGGRGDGFFRWRTFCVWRWKLDRVATGPSVRLGDSARVVELPLKGLWGQGHASLHPLPRWKTANLVPELLLSAVLCCFPRSCGLPVCLPSPGVCCWGRDSPRGLAGSLERNIACP